MVGDFTCTSAISGAATNTVEAAPGSLIAVPLLTSSVSVGCCGGTTWLCANGRLGAPVTDGGAGAAPGVGGIGTGCGRACASRVWGACVSESAVGSGAGTVGETTGGMPIVGVSEAFTTDARCDRAIAAGG